MEKNEAVIEMRIRFSGKAIENLGNFGIYEFQRNEMKAGIYDICVCRNYQTDDIMMFAQKEGVNHLFTFVIPSDIRQIQVGKTTINIKYL
jgi:hypothetical protein